MEIKCTINVRCLNHPTHTPGGSMRKLTSMKLVPDAKNVGDCCPKGSGWKDPSCYLLTYDGCTREPVHGAGEQDQTFPPPSPHFSCLFWKVLLSGREWDGMQKESQLTSFSSQFLHKPHIFSFPDSQLPHCVTIQTNTFPFLILRVTLTWPHLQIHPAAPGPLPPSHPRLSPSLRQVLRVPAAQAAH